MDFLSRLRTLFSSSKAKSVTGGVWQTLYQGDIADRNLLSNNKEWVFIAVDKVARAVASIPIKVMRYQTKDDVEVFEGPLVDFMESPAENITTTDFVYLNTAYKELTGNAFWEKMKFNKLAPLIPTNVTPKVTDNKLTGYTYSDGVKIRDIDIKNMLHDRSIDPAKPYWGVGKLAKISRWADTSSYANEFLRMFFVNGAQFGGFITTEEETEERIHLIKMGLANDHVGVQNAHKMGVLPKGSDFKPATSSMNDMQFRELDDQYRDKILSAFGVPKTLVGLTTDVNRASAEASEYIFAKYTIKPAIDDLIEFLNVNIAPLLDPSGKYYFAVDEDYIPENEEVEMKERQAALNNQAYMTVNEVRADEGLPPITGGDVIYMDPKFQPIGSPAPAPVAPAAPAGDIQNEPAPKKMLKHMRKALRTERSVDSILEKALEIAERMPSSQDEAAHKQFVSRVNEHEALLAEKMRDFNNRQQRDVLLYLNLIKSKTKAFSKGDIFDIQAEIKVLVDFVTPLLQGLMIEQAIQEYAANNFGGTFDSTSEIISKTVLMAAERLGKSYNSTTTDLLAKTLDEGIKNGEDTALLAARVQEVYHYSDAVRAEAVARTESFYIANAGSKEAYRQSGVVSQIRWYTAEDEKVCPFCGPLDGTVVGIEENFYEKGDTITVEHGHSMSLDYRDIGEPPLHTNCRCFIRAVIA